MTGNLSILTIMTKRTISVAEAKKRLSEIVVRAACGNEIFVITRRGRPAAVLRAVGSEAGGRDLADLRGWLPETDAFFAHLEEGRRLSRKRGPRAAR